MRATKAHIWVLGILQVLIVSIVSIVSASQETQPGRPRLEILSHSVVETVQATFGQRWIAKEPAKHKGLVVSLKMTFEPGIEAMPADNFSASFISRSGIDRAVSFGITLPFFSLDDATDAMKNLWLFQDPTAKERVVVRPENMKCCTLYFAVLLAPLPLDTNEVSLENKGSVIGTIQVKR